MTLWKKSGTLLLATGFIHNLFGIVLGWPVLSAIVKDGFVNTVQMQMDRNALFWFLFSGFLMMLMGKMMQDSIEQHQRPAPANVGYFLLLLSVTGCLMMPASGIWLAIPQAFIILLAQKSWPRQTRPSSNPLS